MSNVLAEILTENEADAELVGAWIDEWMESRRLKDALRREPADEFPFDADRLRAAAGEYDREIWAGQVRILSKTLTNEPEEIPYVAVVEEWEPGNWLIVPFSPYSYPATPLEMVSGCGNAGLRVLQAWNGRTVPTALLERGYCIGRLSDEMVEKVRALFRRAFSGKALPESFDVLRGAEILMEEDPRRDYQRETLDRFRPLSTAVHAMALWSAWARDRTQDQVRESFITPSFGRPDYAVAAASEETDRTDTYAVKTAELSVTYSPEDGTVTFVFYDRDDRPDTSYDGYGLFGAGMNWLGVFCGGCISVSAEPVRDGFKIVAPDGTPIKVDIEKKD